MKKNWYIVYTKPQFEKRAAAFFAKRKMEYYLPLISTYPDSNGKKAKPQAQPLFQSFVFVFATAEAVCDIKKGDGVLSVLYWKDQPAVINADEIEAIKGFIQVYPNIRVENSLVNSGEPGRKVSNAYEAINGKIYSVSYQEVRLNLPSMGFTLVANPDTGHGNTVAGETFLKTSVHTHSS